MLSIAVEVSSQFDPSYLHYNNKMRPHACAILSANSCAQKISIHEYDRYTFVSFYTWRSPKGETCFIINFTEVKGFITRHNYILRWNPSEERFELLRIHTYMYMHTYRSKTSCAKQNLLPLTKALSNNNNAPESWKASSLRKWRTSSRTGNHH